MPQLAIKPVFETTSPALFSLSNPSHPNAANADAPNSTADIVIVGAGLAGSIAALVLARQGKRVTIIDRHAIYPREFRCEKLSPMQMELMRELDVLDLLNDVTCEFNQTLVVRNATSASPRRQEERGLAYSDMVNRLRQAWPEEVHFIEGRVAGVTTSPDLQRVCLADGHVIETRLAVLATGPRDKLHVELGFKRQITRHAHSFCIGFGILPAGNTVFPFQSMTYFGEYAGDRIGYATFFPISDGMRVNLFCYHDKYEPWIQAFRHDPIGKLREAMPGIGRFLGDFSLVTPVEIRPVDLYRTENACRDGIVLIGDAFRSSCPATGAGVTRLLTDVRQLCLVHVPLWFASSGMDANKIASFYSDPLKRNCDNHSDRAAERGRHLATKTSLRWRIERFVLDLAGRWRIAGKLASRWRKTQSFMS